jgi:hypothetical protein
VTRKRPSDFKVSFIGRFSSPLTCKFAFKFAAAELMHSAFWSLGYRQYERLLTFFLLQLRAGASTWKQYL